MSEKVSISIALCTYNGEKFVRDQVQSILSQSVPPDEVVISDDGSSDRTLELIETLRSAAPVPMRVIRSGPRLGIVKNFETAILATRGDLIFLSDQDDVWHPRRIEHMAIAFAQDHRVRLAYCDAYVIDGVGRRTGQTVFSQRPHLRQPELWPVSRLIRGTWIKGCMMAFHRKLVPLLMPFPKEWYYDHWVGLVAAASSRLACVDLPLMDYRRHASNASDDPFARSTWRRLLHLVLTRAVPHRYESDVVKWQGAIDSLTARLGRGQHAPGDVEKTRVLVAELQQRLDFALMRSRLHAASRLVRLPRVVRHTAHGHYHRYGAGWGSALRDLFCR